MNDSINLVANATKDGTEVQNDFDSLYPWNSIISYNLDLETKEKKAFYGDPDFKFDGTNGDVYTYYPRFWFKFGKMMNMSMHKLQIIKHTDLVSPKHSVFQDI